MVVMDIEVLEAIPDIAVEVAPIAMVDEAPMFMPAMFILPVLKTVFGDWKYYWIRRSVLPEDTSCVSVVIIS